MIVTNCPNCGAAFARVDSNCEYCGTMYITPPPRRRELNYNEGVRAAAVMAAMPLSEVEIKAAPLSLWQILIEAGMYHAHAMFRFR